MSCFNFCAFHNTKIYVHHVITPGDSEISAYQAPSKRGRWGKQWLLMDCVTFHMRMRLFKYVDMYDASTVAPSFQHLLYPIRKNEYKPHEPVTNNGTRGALTWSTSVFLKYGTAFPTMLLGQAVYIHSKLHWVMYGGIRWWNMITEESLRSICRGCKCND